MPVAGNVSIDLFTCFYRGWSRVKSAQTIATPTQHIATRDIFVQDVSAGAYYLSLHQLKYNVSVSLS